ncbi:hypothetical protein AJ78_04924 [Emergomyces pasteurianus Ep9510]|uniref:DUF7492 domain-containing protein n=1 Tax=Emergomyces pasteurianus Ep9510 TaxID=1447872 RepID=A0A1J9PFL4_9EURO|nr:hypothetical protein AJ78_04924 [Emergomyces pasteurianus Ep9510]
MRKLRPFLALMANVFYLLPIVAGHSWVDELTVIAKNGTFTGAPGFPRGYVPRDKPGFTDFMMQYLLPLPPGSRTGGPLPGPPKILPTDNICKDTQTKQVQTDGKPRLKAPPGSPIALRYQENGHVTLPSNTPGKPDNRGTVYVYGTTDPRPDDKFTSIHKVWNKDGTGGDRRGMLLSVQDYDDGRCYQINDKDISKERQQKFPHKATAAQGQNLWCQHDLALPKNAPEGKPYTLYWVWDWPTIPDKKKGVAALDEVYTTCMDIDITPASKLKVAAKGEPHTLKFVEGQDLGYAAIPTQFENLKAPTIPGDSGSDSPPLSPQPSAASSQQPFPAGEKQAPTPTPTPSPNPSPPASEQDLKPKPSGNDCICGQPAFPPTAPQSPNIPPSDTPPAIIPLFPSTPGSEISPVPSPIAPPGSTPTDLKGGDVFTIFPGTLTFLAESDSVTPSPTPTASLEQPPTNSDSRTKPVTPSILPSPGRGTLPNPSRPPLFLTIIDSSPATAITATTPPAVPDDIVTPSPPSTPESTPTPRNGGGAVVIPVSLDAEGNLIDPSPSFAEYPIPQLTATPSATPTVVDCMTEELTKPPQPTETNPETKPSAIIPLPANQPSDNTVSNSRSNVLPTVTESPTPTQRDFIIFTITVTATETVYPTTPPDTPAAQAQGKAQTAPTVTLQSSGFVVSTRPSSSTREPLPSPSPPAVELSPDELPSPDYFSDGGSIPTPSSPLEPPPSSPSKRAFRMLSSRFRRNLAEIQENGDV